MANSPGLAVSFLLELLNGIHALGTSVVRAGTTPDSFKAALYLSSASVGPSTPAYTATGEVSGAGYSAGGVDLTGSPDWIAPASSGSTVYSTPTASIVFSSVTLSTSFNACLIYNATQGNKAVGVCVFDAQTVIAGTLTLTMPTNNNSTALLRLTGA